jgi:tetratricopeptide (TPR) repeat protein
MEEFLSSRDIEEKGYRLWERFELDEALKVFRQGIERFPDDKKLKAGLAFTHLDLGDIPQARGIFERLLAVDPKDDECWWGLGRIHLLLSNYGEARFCFDRALETAKADERVLLDVGREWYMLGCYEESVQYYGRALKANERSAEALLGQGACQFWLDHSDAESTLKKALEIEPTYHDCRSFLANMYYTTKRFDEALVEFERIPLSAHNDTVSVNRLIRLLRKQGAPDAKVLALREELKRLSKEQGWDAFLASLTKKNNPRGLPDQGKPE